MKRVILTLLFTLFTTVLLALPSFNSVVPIDSAAGNHICTAWSLNKAKRYFVTAGHCVDEQNLELPVPHIRSMRTTTVMFNREQDIAIVTGPIGLPAMKIKFTAPNIGDDVAVGGYPFGLEKVITQGRLVILHQKLELEPDKTIFVIPGTAPGNSGSPITDMNGNVISVLQVGWRVGDLVGGIPWEVMARLLLPYAE